MIASRVEGGQGQAGAGSGAVVIDVYARISYAVTGETVKTDDQVEMGEEALERRGAVLRRVFRDESMKGARPGLRFRMSHSRGEWTKCSTAVD
jgi:hypothetical protein